MQTLQNKLQQIITANRLQVFYPPQELQKVMARLGKVDFRYELKADQLFP